MIDVEWFSDFNKCTTKMRINDTKSNLDNPSMLARSLKVSHNIDKSLPKW